MADEAMEEATDDGALLTELGWLETAGAEDATDDADAETEAGADDGITEDADTDAEAGVDGMAEELTAGAQPVSEGTALVPVPMATRLEPQSSAWPMWTLRLSQSNTTYADRRKESPRMPTGLSYAPSTHSWLLVSRHTKSPYGTLMVVLPNENSTEPPSPESKQSTRYRSELGTYWALGNAATSWLKTAVGNPLR